MIFKILDRFGRPSSNAKNKAYLIWDNWNDYNFYTSFGLIYKDEDSVEHKIGAVKVGSFGQKKLEKKLSIGETFESLKDQYFSLGQSDGYYSILNSLGSAIRDSILYALNDIAKDTELFERAIKEDVTKVSLFRTVSPTSVTGQFRRLANGEASLTDYYFKFIAPKRSYELTFQVEPESFPPTNIHVLIGRNGVGKTYLINNMINSLIDYGGSIKNYGEFVSKISVDSSQLFANLIFISFSAFDEAVPRPEIQDKTKGLQFSYIGLKQIQSPNDDSGPKSTTILKNEFYKSLSLCKISSKADRWKRCIEMLESDPNFKEANITSLIDTPNEAEFKVLVFNIFKRLSSGHKIVLLTLTKLIERLQERSLVLIDEPEAHLHPPLLSAFIRAISDLLITTNGVAIIATHSPVIIQEVPRSCVWKLRRNGIEVKAERPEIETFGENVGVLTNEIFGFEVSNSGFYKMINEIVQEEENYENVIDYFNNELGMEARAIIMSLLANKNKIFDA